MPQPPHHAPASAPAPHAPVTFDGDRLLQQLLSDRLLSTLPDGGALLAQVSKSSGEAGHILRHVREARLVGQLRARVAALRPDLLEALDHILPPAVGMTAIRSSGAALPVPLASRWLRGFADDLGQSLRDPSHHTTVLTGPPGSGRTALLALVAEDPRTHAAFPGGVHVSCGIHSGGLLDILRDIGTHWGHGPLARAIDLERALAQLRNQLLDRPFLLIVDDVADFRPLQRLRSGLGQGHHLLLTTTRLPTEPLEARVLRIPPLDAHRAERLFSSWAPDLSDTPATRSLARALSVRASLVLRSARLLSGPDGWLDPSDLLTALRAAPFRSTPDALAAPLAETALQAASPRLVEALQPLHSLPCEPVVLPEALVHSVVGASQWATVCATASAAGFVRCIAPGLWTIPRACHDVLCSRAARGGNHSVEARKRALRWVRSELASASAHWHATGPVPPALQRARTHRMLLLRLLGPDLPTESTATGISFGLVAWLLPRPWVEDAVARLRSQPHHPWHGAAWRWEAEHLQSIGRGSDAIQLLTTMARSRHSADATDAAFRLAALLVQNGHPDRACPVLQQLAAKARQQHASARAAQAALRLGTIHSDQQRWTLAREAFCSAADAFRVAQSTVGAVEATGRLCLVAASCGLPDEAAEHLRRQTALAALVADRTQLTEVYERLAIAAVAHDQPDQALTWLNRAARSGPATDAPRLQPPAALAARAAALLAIGRVPEALSSAHQRIEAARLRCDLSEEAEATSVLARMLVKHGGGDEALQLLTDALLQDRAVGDGQSEVRHLIDAAETHHALGSFFPALVCFDAAQVVAAREGWRDGEAMALERGARCAMHSGQTERALRYGHRALLARRTQQQVEPLARWMVIFGGMVITAGARDHGQQLQKRGAQVLAEQGWSKQQLAELWGEHPPVRQQA